MTNYLRCQKAGEGNGAVTHFSKGWQELFHLISSQDIVGKEGLGDDLDGLVSLLDIKLSDLLQQGRRSNAIAGRLNPQSKRVVGVITTSFKVATTILNGQLADTLLDGLGSDIGGQFFLCNCRFLCIRQFSGLLENALCYFVVVLIPSYRVLTTASILPILLRCVRCFALGGLLGRILENILGKFMAHVDHGRSAASFAITKDFLGLGDREYGFRILAFTAEDEFVDEAIKELTHAVGIMCTIYDPAISPLVEDGSGAEFTTEVFRGV